MIDIKDLCPADEAEWLGLWQAYLEFYRTSLPAETTAVTWARILDPACPIHGRGARLDGALVGFALAIVHPGTWSDSDMCYLEDLYVGPEARGTGVGGALIDDLVAMAKREGWFRLYWHTGAGNVRARTLYDRFTPCDEVVRYTLRLGS